ncbi:MAG: CotH kinase family protein, partial [Planctomycetota bacterium]
VEQSTRGEAPAGWPSGNVNGQQLDYGMDSSVVGRLYSVEEVQSSLTSIPSVSIVTELDNLFDSGDGIYVNARNRGSDWERPTSVEWIYPDGQEGFQIDAGLRIRGGFSRSGGNPKHAFRLFFGNDYDGPLEYALFGDEGVDEFRNIDLRTAQNYSWSFQGDDQNTFARDIFSRDTQRDMGDPYTRSRYYHLYLNGQYWGVFQTQERSEASYAESYFGGDADDYDVVKTTGNDAGYTIEATDGNMDAWTEMWNQTLAVADNPTDANYYRLQGLNADGTRNPDYPVLLDVDQMIDYLLISFYTGNTDAPLSNFLGNDRPNNWFAIRNRETGDEGFTFFQHDAEHSLGTSSSANDRTGPFDSPNERLLQYSNPQFIHQHLMAHPEYRLKVADRVQQHMFNGGALTENASIDRFMARVAQVEPAIIAESARWGDAKTSTPLDYDDWQNEVNWVVNSFFPGRTEVVVAQLNNDDLYPDVDAPLFNQHGGGVPAGFGLNMSVGDAGSRIYYTLDGSDPRQIGGSPSPQAEILESAGGSVELLPRGSSWNYFDAGGEPGSDWTTPGFDDASWKVGDAQFGYGDGDESTIVDFGPSANDKHVTTYFRTAFDVANPSEFSGLTLSLLRDDGASVYLNGVEVVRSNLPGRVGEPLSSTQLASSSVGGTGESTFIDYAISPNLLVSGTNVIAVEVHQVAGNSSDLSFDLGVRTRLTTEVLKLDESAVVSARAYDPSTREWSALNQAS